MRPTAAATGPRAVVPTRFGAFAADPRDVLTVVEPLAGFEACRRFVLVSSADIAPFVCLQGLDEPRPSFLAIDPHIVASDYRQALGSTERRRLEADSGSPLLWLSLVCAGEAHTTVNLRAPIVINPDRMIALQLVVADSRYSTEHPLDAE